jgi:hypothetical protein
MTKENKIKQRFAMRHLVPANLSALVRSEGFGSIHNRLEVLRSSSERVRPTNLPPGRVLETKHLVKNDK